ncbi:hypothetical protein BP5796_05531 [Coleophoma crateriformis]|uniref:DUF4385 domain-containing protein n=1 Tax=Coleophoma crateriformis TaxID=565419 RepID=A0A3D8S3F2_9HELO|nr:hypothetical protein BP5796_05531 [Coleophoma crateriformis]
MSTFTKPTKAHLMTYHIARGEMGVLTYEPYKSYLLPHWRFRTAAIARTSADKLWDEFLQFYENDDFVGMDMARKFIQMGMTRAKRYANYKGGRKYVDGKDKGNRIEKSGGHAGREEKERASLIFREVWDRCRQHEGYQRMKGEFLMEQKEWTKTHNQAKLEKEREIEIKEEHPKIKIEND